MESLELIAKRMHQSGDHIEKFKVKLYAPNIKIVKPEYEMTRVDLLSRVNAGARLFTRNPSGSFTEVHIITVTGNVYFRTDRNEIASDNLEYLPDF